MPRASATLAVLGLGAAYAWGWVRIFGAPPFPPRTSTERGLAAVLAGVVLALVPALMRAGHGRRAWIHVVMAPLAVALVAGGLGTPALHGWHLTAVVLGAIVFGALLDLATFCPTPVFALATAASLAASAQVFLMFGAANLARLAGTIGIAMVLAGLVSVAFRQHLPASVAVPLAAIITVLSVDDALFSYEVPPILSLVLFAAAPVVPLAIYLGPAGRLGARKSLASALLLTLATTATGFFIAWRAAPESGG
jgi:hypothetical protein